MEIRILGNVEIHGGHEVITLTRSAERCLLGLLAVDVGRPVTVTTLLDRIWGEEGRGEPKPETLTRYAGYIRDALGQAGGERAWLRHEPGANAYLLDVNPDTIDYHRFLRTAHSAAEHRDPDRLHDALTLWRGTPLQNVRRRWVDTFRHHAHTHRRSALASLWELLLEHGRYHEIPPQLGPLEIDIVHDERLLLLGAEALARAGRHVDITTWADHIVTRMRELSGGTGLSATTQAQLHHFITHPPGPPTAATSQLSTLPNHDGSSDGLGAEGAIPGTERQGRDHQTGTRSTTIHGSVNGAPWGITIGAATGDHLTINTPSPPGHPNHPR